MSWVDIPALGIPQTWDDALSDARSVGEAREALAFFRSTLHDGWRGWSAGFPLAARFFVALQNGPSEGVRLYRMLRRLDAVANVDRLVRKDLGSGTWREYGAAVMAVEFCSRVRTAGGDVEFVQTTHEASPDVRVKLDERWVTVEFKALHDHDAMMPWNAWDDRVFAGLCTRDLGAVAFDVDLEEEALFDSDAVVEGLAAIAGGGHHEYQPLPRNVGRARLAAINVGNWAYPVSQKDELTRIRSNLMNKWCRQLGAASGARILVVRANTVFRDGASFPADARRVADAVRPVLNAKPMLSALLVYEEPFIAPLLGAVDKGDDYRAIRETSPIGTARFAVLLHNTNASAPLGETELARALSSSGMSAPK